MPETPNPPTVYAVWVTGDGWLRSPSKRIIAFADPYVGAAAVEMYGPAARLVAFDESMKDLEEVFLIQERNRALAQQPEKGWRAWLTGTR